MERKLLNSVTTLPRAMDVHIVTSRNFETLPARPMRRLTSMLCLEIFWGNCTRLSHASFLDQTFNHQLLANKLKYRNWLSQYQKVLYYSHLIWGLAQITHWNKIIIDPNNSANFRGIDRKPVTNELTVHKV